MFSHELPVDNKKVMVIAYDSLAIAHGSVDNGLTFIGPF